MISATGSHPLPETDRGRYDPEAPQFERLMVIIPHSLSGLVNKGEIVERYYNPGGIFRQVHLVLTNDDKPDTSFVQKMVGDAELHIHNVPLGSHFFLRTLGWRPFLVRKWADKVLEVAREVRPQLIRCHGGFYNAFAASEIKRQLKIPYVVSLHTNPDQSLGLSRADRIQWRFLDDVARAGLRNADLVLPVYEGIKSYLKRLSIDRIEVAYNVINPSGIVEKTDYRIEEGAKIISVGRLIEGKSPENIIHAVGGMRGTSLKIVGDGPLYDHLNSIIERKNIGDRVKIIRSLPNDDLCRELADYDIFGVSIEKWGISKTVLEAFLTGLPVITNRPDPRYVPEINSNIALLVDNTPEGYRQGLERLISDDREREQLGREAAQYAWDRWSPAKAEAHYTQIYRTVLASGGTQSTI